MKTTTRNRAASLGIAAIAGLAGIGLASGPALAASAPAEASSAETVSADVGTQSVYYPTDAVKYADELVVAWGRGNMSRVEGFASANVFSELSNHGSDEAKHWKRVGGEGAAGTTWVDYENTVTGEKMGVGVSTEAVHNGGEWGTPHGVHKIQFTD